LPWSGAREGEEEKRSEWEGGRRSKPQKAVEVVEDGGWQ